MLCACSYLFENFDWRLSQFPQFNFFSLFVFILCYPVFTLSVLCTCLHLVMMTMLVFCYVYFWVLIPLQVVLHLGISSPANSSVKNSKKSPIHPPLVDNALSIGIRARYSLVLCDFGLTAWSFSYADCRIEERILPHLWRSWVSSMAGHDEEATHGNEQWTVDRHWDWSYRSM